MKAVTVILLWAYSIYSYYKNPIQLNADLARFQVSAIQIQYPAENQYPPIAITLHRLTHLTSAKLFTEK